MLVCCEGELLLLLIQWSEDGLAWEKQETPRNRRRMVVCNRLSEVGLRHAGGGATAPLSQPTPSPCSGGLLAGFGSHPRWCSAQISCVGGLLYSFHLRISALRFLNCAFCLVFHLYLNVCPTKHVFSNTSGTTSIVYAYVSKVCLFLLFWTLIGGRI